jgi:hypothetical protein
MKEAKRKPRARRARASASLRFAATLAGIGLIGLAIFIAVQAGTSEPATTDALASSEGTTDAASSDDDHVVADEFGDLTLHEELRDVVVSSGRLSLAADATPGTPDVEPSAPRESHGWTWPNEKKVADELADDLLEATRADDERQLGAR